MSGRLVYVVGPSGAGKDSLIAHARAAGPPHTVFAHRYITRPATAGGENHVALTPAEFALRQAAGCFALHWHSHGLDYALGLEIDLWRARGLTVVANGSRGALPAAAARYPDLLPVLITVDPAVLAGRLARRGRESAADMAERLAGAALRPADHPAQVVIDNSGALTAAGDALVALLRRLA